MRLRILTFSAMLLMAGTLSSRAGATPNFPPEIQTHLELQDSPACALCHNGDPGKGTATTPFAVNMKARGLVEFDIASLDAALDRMAADHVDSIGDCLDDIDELKAGNDPNQPDPPGICEDAGANPSGGPAITAPPESPRYGCVGRVAPAPFDGSSAPLLIIGAVWLALTRRRKAPTK